MEKYEKMTKEEKIIDMCQENHDALACG